VKPHTPKNELQRLIQATINSMKGYRRVWLDEAAFRFQVVVLIVTLPVAWLIANSWLIYAVLVGSWAMVLVAELGNSAIEAAIDRIGPEQHDLAAKAKDAGSAMVLTSMLISGGVWLAVIADLVTGT
jgi:diacylglycerol kinase (ATP)